MTESPAAPTNQRTSPPGIGELAESLQYDCKATYENPQSLIAHLEIAKDIAAMANSAGGVLFVGISEDRATRRVTGYVPKTNDEIRAIIDGIEAAAEKYLRPRPLFATTTLKVPDASIEIVVIDVATSSNAPVGVLVPPTPDQKKVHGKAEQSFRFPFRHGTQTVYLLPEQLSLIMEAKTRRMGALLAGIPESSRGDVRVLRGTMWEKHEFLAVDLLTNSFTTRLIGGHARGMKPNAAAHSLDLVETVYASVEGIWSIVLSKNY